MFSVSLTVHEVVPRAFVLSSSRQTECRQCSSMDKVMLKTLDEFDGRRRCTLMGRRDDDAKDP